jgi:hypothetical protein
VEIPELVAARLRAMSQELEVTLTIDYYFDCVTQGDFKAKLDTYGWKFCAYSITLLKKDQNQVRKTNQIKHSNTGNNKSYKSTNQKSSTTQKDTQKERGKKIRKKVTRMARWLQAHSGMV